MLSTTFAMAFLSRKSAASPVALNAAQSGIREWIKIPVFSTWRGKSVHAIAMVSMLLILALVLVLPIAASAAGPDTSLEELRAAAEKISSISGDFVQEKHMPILARPLVAKGYFAYQRPASLRWEYRKPLQSVLLLHDGSVNRYIHTEKGWQEDAAANLQSMDFILQEISSWLNGRFEDNPLFDAAIGKDKTVILTPKDKSMDQFIRRIELVMADQPGVMKQVTIFEGEDAFTSFTFVDPHINDKISPSAFRKIR
jgi:outer membrane lipoprotein-sorting protein